MRSFKLTSAYTVVKTTLLTEPKRPILNIFYSYTPTKQCATHHLLCRMGEQTLIWQYVCCDHVWPVALNIPDVQYGVGVSWAEPQRFIYSIIHLHVTASTGRPHQKAETYTENDHKPKHHNSIHNYTTIEPLFFSIFDTFYYNFELVYI